MHLITFKENCIILILRHEKVSSLAMKASVFVYCGLISTVFLLNPQLLKVSWSCDFFKFAGTNCHPSLVCLLLYLCLYVVPELVTLTIIIAQLHLKTVNNMQLTLEQLYLSTLGHKNVCCRIFWKRIFLLCKGRNALPTSLEKCAGHSFLNWAISSN